MRYLCTQLDMWMHTYTEAHTHADTHTLTRTQSQLAVV